MSATSRDSSLGSIGCGSGAVRKLAGGELQRGELSRSLKDMPAWRAEASAFSRTDGSMPSTLHDTREFMLSSGSDFGAPPAPSASPRVPVEETIEFRAGRLPLASTFSCYGK